MTFEEIAAELGVDERTARRTVEAVLAKLRASLADAAAEPDLVVRVLVLVLAGRDFPSTEEPTFSRVPRRFSDNPTETALGAARVTSKSLSRGCRDRESMGRARLPSRFPRKP